MKLLWALPILFALPAAASDLDSAVSQCNLAGYASPSSLDPDEFEEVLEKEMAAKEQACKKAEQILSEKENQSSALRANIAEISASKLSEIVEKAELSVNAQLESLTRLLREMRSIPNEVSRENNLALQSLRQRLESTRKNAASLESRWDESHRLPTDHPLARLLIGRSQLPPQAQSALNKYLDRLPPYLTGKAPAPRKKIQFLQQKLEVSRRALDGKNIDYTAETRGESRSKLRENLSPEKLAARAESIRAALLQRFGHRTSSWLKLASLAGACPLAQHYASNQTAMMKESIKLAGAALKPILEIALAADLRARELAACRPEVDEPRLQLSLTQSLRALASACGNSEEAKVLGLDIREWQALPKTQFRLDERSALHAIGEELWQRSQQLITHCQKGGDR